MRNRIISNRITEKSRSPFGRIIVITGARQTGKTTLVKRLFSEFEYISVEDPVKVNEYKSLTASMWKSLFPKAILDEIQKEAVLVESIKSVYDQFEDCRYVLLGSSQLMLLKKVRESLAGRCHIFELYPLTLTEMLTNSWEDSIQSSYLQNLFLGNENNEVPFLLSSNHEIKLNVFNEYQEFGAYPALSKSGLGTKDKMDWLKNYVKTYLERDIRDLADLRSLEPFTKVQNLFALNTAQLVNYSKIAQDAGVSVKTAQRFLEYMTISYQAISLKAWSRNHRKRLAKSSKVHFLDIGVLRTILQKRDKLNGHEYESAIVSEVYKQINNIDVEVDFFHLRTLDGREVDLIIETEHFYIAIEIKQTSNIRKVDGKHLRHLEEILDKPVKYKFVISNDLKIKDLGYGIKAIPAIQFLT